MIGDVLLSFSFKKYNILYNIAHDSISEYIFPLILLKNQEIITLEVII